MGSPAIKDETWEEFFRRLRLGRTAPDICNDQDMPARSSYTRRMREPEFRKRVVSINADRVHPNAKWVWTPELINRLALAIENGRRVRHKVKSSDDLPGAWAIDNELKRNPELRKAIDDALIRREQKRITNAKKNEGAKNDIARYAA